MTISALLTAALPGQRPDDEPRNLLLFAFRRMGAHGIDDAHVAHAYLATFGRGYRRPLLLMRTLMMELADAATRPVSIAPPCCGRLTPSEVAMLDIMARAASNPAAAGLLLADMLGVRNAGRPLATATALAGAFHDFGMPLSG